MKETAVSRAASYFSDALLSETDALRKKRQRRRSVYSIYIAVAACLVLLLSAALLLHKTLPPLTVGDFFAEGEGDGMGGRYAESADALTDGNPWTPDTVFSSLPVYAHCAFSEEERLSLLRDTAKRLSLPDGDITADAFFTVLKTDTATVSVYAEGDITIQFTPKRRLSALSDYAYGCTAAQATACIEPLKEAFFGLLGMKKPHAVLEGGEYDFFAKPMGYTVAFYDAAGSEKQQFLRFQLHRTYLYPTEEGGGIDLVRIYAYDRAEKVGDYPIISLDEATALLQNGNFITAVGDDLPETLAPEKVALVYRTSHADSHYMPYYCFTVRLRDDTHTVAHEKGIPSFGEVYVPAVQARYLTALPVWDGTTSK